MLLSTVPLTLLLLLLLLLPLSLSLKSRASVSPSFFPQLAFKKNAMQKKEKKKELNPVCCRWRECISHPLSQMWIWCACVCMYACV